MKKTLAIFLSLIITFSCFTLSVVPDSASAEAVGSYTNFLADMTADDWYDKNFDGYSNVNIVVDDASSESRYGGTAIKLSTVTAYRASHMKMPILAAGTYKLQVEVYHPANSGLASFAILGNVQGYSDNTAADPTGMQIDVYGGWQHLTSGQSGTEAGWRTYTSMITIQEGYSYDLYFQAATGCSGMIFSDFMLTVRESVPTSVVGSGVVTAEPATAYYGDSVTYKAEQSADSSFVGWFNGDTLLSVENTISGFAGINIPTARFKNADKNVNLFENKTLSDWISGITDHRILDNAKETNVSRYGGYSFISTSVHYQGIRIPFSVKANKKYVLTFSAKASATWEGVAVLDTDGFDFSSGKCYSISDKFDTEALAALNANVYRQTVDGVADLEGVSDAKWTDITIEFTPDADSDTYALYLAWGESLAYNNVIISDLCLMADSTNTYFIPEIEGKYKTQGRTTVQDDLLILDQSASGIEFNATCEGDVKVTFNTSYLLDEYGLYFTVIVDGEIEDRDLFHISQTGETTFTIAEDLLSAEHSFEIYRQSETVVGTTGIKTISLNGDLCNAPKENGLSIEFVGDGVTAALGNIFNGTPAGAAVELSSLYQDATKGYAYLTAKKLNADFSVVAENGIGASVGWLSYSMHDVYTKLHSGKDNLEYDFSKTNDVVVLALGKSDYDKVTSGTATEANVKQGFKNLLTLIREKNPTSKIVWIYGMQNSTANSAIIEAVSAAGGSGNGYYTLDLTAYKNVAGGNYHPYYTAHEKISEALASFINENFYWPNKTVSFTTFKGASIKDSTDDGEQGIRLEYSLDSDIITNGYQGYTVKQIGLLAIKDKYLNKNALLIDRVYENKKASVGLFYDAKTGKNMISDNGIASAFLYNIGYNYSNKTVDFSDYSSGYTTRCFILLNDGKEDFYLYDDYQLSSIFEIMQEIKKEYINNPSDDKAISDNTALETLLSNTELIDKNSKTVKEYYDGYQTEATTYLAGEIILTSEFEYKNTVYTVDTTVVFTNQSSDPDNPEIIKVPAYWNGGNEWIIRYALPTEGDWQYTTYCTDTKNSGLHYINGSINCTKYSGDLDIYKNGFLKAEEGKKYMTYADGTPFFYLGDTHWSLPMEDLQDANGSQYINGKYRALTDAEISALKQKYAGYENIDQLGEVSQFEFIMNYRAKQGFTVIQSQQLGIYNGQGGDEGNSWMADKNGDVFEQGITSGMLEKFNTLDKYFSYIAELGFVHSHTQYTFTEELIKAYKHGEITNKQLKKLARYWVARYSAYPVIWATAQEADDDYYKYHNIDEDNDGIVDGCTCAVTEDNLCKPWYNLMNYVAEYDPYDHPSTAHQEGSETLYQTGSYFDDSENHDFYAAQQQFKVENYETNEMPWYVIKDFWNKNKPVINYEGAYDGYWASEKSARAQGWLSYLNGMYGCGYGVQPIFNLFWANIAQTSTDYKPDMTWVDGVYAKAAEDMSTMKSFFTEYLPNNLGICWWDLIPNFNDGSYYTSNNSEYNYSVAAATDKNSKTAYIGYFAGSTETTDLGRLKNMSKSTTYYYHWYDTATGELVKTYTYKSSSSRTWNAVAKSSGYYSSSGPGVKPNTNDLLLVVSTTKLTGNIS